MSKLDKNLLRFLNELIVKCSSLDQFKLFNSCFEILLTETQKPMPTHGYKLFIQLLLNQTPSLFIQNMNIVSLQSTEWSSGQVVTFI